MRRDFPSSRDTDIEEQYLAPTDVKQYVFCPRVTYFTRVMHLRPVMGSQQEAAKKTHEKVSGLEKRRKRTLKTDLPFDVAEKTFDVHLVSDRLQVHGRLDMLIETTAGEFIPVEFKDMESNRGRVRLDHKYQLLVLALLVEDSWDTVVRRGLVHYLRDETTVEVPFTHSLKRRTERVLEDIRAMIQSGTMPAPRRRCAHARVGCGFADVCCDF